ncbi:MAG: hypothetical protein AAF959_30215 [Cyanobacteria bacterium P01_D01_bin.56]
MRHDALITYPKIASCDRRSTTTYYDSEFKRDGQRPALKGDRISNPTPWMMDAIALSLF